MNNQIPNVGHAIRALRERQKLSLRDLSETCGLSVNAISKIERGENSPTVASLHKLASALDVHISSLFTEAVDQITVFTQQNNTMRIQGNGILIEGLGSGIPNQRLEPFRMTIEPGEDNLNDPASHSGDEFVHCFEGELEYLVGEKSYFMNPGDSLVFKASQPHSWRNTGKLPAKVILVFETDQTQPVPHRHYGDR
jgi:transcriptional regulator with XRE-family HTH domain